MLTESKDMKTRSWKTAGAVEAFPRPDDTSIKRGVNETAKTRNSSRKPVFDAFTVVELLIVVTVLFLLAMLLIPNLAESRKRAERITCNNHLKQLGTAFKIWGARDGGLYPMSVSTNKGGTLEYVATGEVYRHFPVMSDAMGASALVLVCPSDKRQGAKDFGPGFSNTNISYFLGVDARGDDTPQMLLAGDRNITNGVPLKNGFLELSANHSAGWTHEVHNGQGNVLLSDGSVQGWNTLGLRKGIENTGNATNRLAMP